MNITVPAALTLTSSTAPESDYDEWNSGTAYVIGDQVVVTTATPHREYESILGGTNNPPAATPTYWLDTGAGNQYRMLDDFVSSQTADDTDDTLTVVLSCAAGGNMVALFALAGVSRVELTVDTGDTVSYPLSLWGPAASWSDYFFDSPQYQESIIMTPPRWTGSATITLALYPISGDAVMVGHVIAGTGVYIGDTTRPIDVGISDYSRKETDEFGETTLVQRAYAKKISADVLVPDVQADFVTSLLASLRATPCLYDMNEPDGTAESMRLFGFYRDFTMHHDDYNATTCTLDLEGLT